MMKSIIRALVDVVAWLFIVASIMFVVAAIVLFPVVLSMLTSWWWLLGYGAYAVILWIIYKIVF